MDEKGNSVAKIPEPATTGGATMPGNVALVPPHGTVVAGVSKNPGALFDGNTTQYGGNDGYASSNWPCHWVITLDRVYRLKEIRLRFWDLDSRSYQYTLEGSVDGKKFFPLADQSKGAAAGWQEVQFSPRPIRVLRLTGLHNSANQEFSLVEFEAYCVPPR
jgi:hypothetical protein